MCHEDIHIEKIRDNSYDIPKSNQNNIFPYLYLLEVNQKNTKKGEQVSN